MQEDSRYLAVAQVHPDNLQEKDAIHSSLW